MLKKLTEEEELRCARSIDERHLEACALLFHVLRQELRGLQPIMVAERVASEFTDFYGYEHQAARAEVRDTILLYLDRKFNKVWS